MARGALASPAGQALVSFVRGDARRRLPVHGSSRSPPPAGRLLLISPLEYIPIVPGRAGDAGYLWRMSDALPTLLGSSLALLGAVPLGAAAAALLVRRSGPSALPTVYLGAFLLAALPVGLVYQKYFDPFMLLAVALFARRARLPHPLRLRRRRACLRGLRGLRAQLRLTGDPPLLDLEHVDHEHERLVRADRRRRSPARRRRARAGS